MDVFSLALEIRNAGSPVDVFTLTLKIKTVSKSSGCFTPVPLNKRELVSLGDCITPTPRNWKSWNVLWMFLAQLLEIRKSW